MKITAALPSQALITLAGGLLFSGVLFSASSLSSDDSDFLKKAAKGGMAEVELGQLAVKKSASPEVRQFANRMIHDHSLANHKLAALAASKGLELPKSTSMGEDVSAAHLKMLSGKSFDEAYVKMMVEDHKEDVADFQKESESAQDPDVKGFAAKTLPTLQSHLTKIEAIQTDFGGTK